jgi:hypothetical protein
VRGDMSLRMHLLLRPTAVVGLVGATAGAAAFVAAYLPWYDVTATVDVLGTSQQRAVASLAGWQAHPWGWLVPAFALLVLVAGVLLAIDRPAPHRTMLLGGCGLALTVVAAGLRFPPVERFDVAGSRLRELAALSGRLPPDVGLAFDVRPATGMWLTLAAAAVVVVVAVLSREPV